MPSKKPQPHLTFVLECLECGAHDGRARGWRAYLDPEGEGLLVFCPCCAEREFGSGG